MICGQAFINMDVNRIVRGALVAFAPPRRGRGLTALLASAGALLVLNILAVAGETVQLVDEPSRAELASYAASLELGTKAIPRAFKFPKDVRSETIVGIDVSHYQKDINWDKVAGQGVSFAYIKSTQGARLYDSSFKINWEAAGQHHMIRRGAYHFMTAKDAGELQANNYLTTVGRLGLNDLPPCLDLEWDFLRRNGKVVHDAKGRKIDQWASLTSQQIVGQVIQWLMTVEAATGKRPIIYTVSSWWAERIGASAVLAKYRLWIADYTSSSLGREAPTVPDQYTWSFWQLTDQGILTLGGINGGVDTSIYHGDINSFVADIH